MERLVYFPHEAAAELGCSVVTIRRHCARLGLGRRTVDDGRSPIVLTAAEVETLRGAVQSGPGNPAMRTATGQRRLHRTRRRNAERSGKTAGGRAAKARKRG